VALLHRVLSIVGFVVLVFVGVGAYLYFTDYTASATVTQHSSDSGGYYVVATTKVLGQDFKKYLSQVEWKALCVGDFVQFAVQSHHVVIGDKEGGRIIYDSQKGLVDSSLARPCTAGA